MSYKNVNYGTKTIRRNYSKVRTEVELPNLIEIQTKSFDWFVNEGLMELFKDISPIRSYDSESLELYFEDYYFEDPKYSVVECKQKEFDYARGLKCKVRLNNKVTGGQIEEEIFMGNIPYMTPVGTFIINGTERVVISQIIRSSGCYYKNEVDKKTGVIRYTGQMLPTRGAWIEFEMGSKDVWYGTLDRSKKIPVTTLLRCFGLSTDKQILDLYGDLENLHQTFEKDDTHSSDEACIEVYSKLRQGFGSPAEGARSYIASRIFDERRYDLQKVGRYKFNKKLDVLERARGHKLAKEVVANDDIFDDVTGELLFEKGEVIANVGDIVSGDILEKLKKAREAYREEVVLENSMEQGNPYCEILYVDVLDGNVEKTVKIVGNDQRETSLHITLSDIFAGTGYYFNLYSKVGTLDDIDHLGNRRLRLIGESLKKEFRTGFARLEKNIVDKMSSVQINEATPKSLINNKPLTSTLKQFFGSSQLSQLMDQINPLAEIAQKRRISALGSGGINRARASTEVRDVHNTHYGRMCPIETPEGQSIGLITSLATYATVDEYGFIQTPYLIVKKDANGKKYVSEEMVNLSADQENGVVIASASTNLDSNGYILDETVIGRRNGETEIVSPDEVDYMDVSPKQVVSVAASCIPFLEHDDATRALMGSNMQRQAVPIIAPEAPIVATGMEHRAAKDSGSACVATLPGIVDYVDATKVVIREEDGNLHEYKLYSFLRSNSSTTIWQRPIVKAGDSVKRGEIIADGQSMQNGELALGRNVRVAYMTWEGYNYEDAVIMSEELVKNDVYTSIHIDNYDVECRDTKLGKEEITRDIPNVGEDQLKYLDENGIVIPGTEVKEGDILVGKVTPKGQSDPSPEDKLLLAIFSAKNPDVSDTSLRVVHGGGGVVQSVVHLKKSNHDEMKPGVFETVRVYIVQKRKIGVGDKMSGRHGNKGVISNVLPVEDMPFSADGQPIDIMLNPQGVPSRMNIGQIMELHVGLAAKKLGIKVATPVFDGITQEELREIMREAGEPEDGKITLYDGRSGEPFENKVNVGITYFIKLSHMVDDKIHARAEGKYTYVTQQPMGGKAQNGGQRFGEMEVWALEGYGAAHTLQEMLTIKSDDMAGRNKLHLAMTEGKPIPEGSIPESFRVLTRELKALGMHVELINNEGENEVDKSILDLNLNEYRKARR